MEAQSYTQSLKKPDCREAGSLIPRFLSGEIGEREMERFLSHIRSCRKCYEELETAFMVDRTVTYLNEDLPLDTSFDLTPLLERELREKALTLRKTRRIRTLRKFILIATLILIALLILDLTGLFHVTVFFAS